MHENHAHCAHSHASNKVILRNSFLIISAFMLIEVAGGFATNSLALLSDAGHMLSDAAALALSLFAFKFGERKGNLQKTFGYKKIEIIAAFINALALIALAIFVTVEAIIRLFSEPVIDANFMLIVSVLGLAVNILVAFYMHKGADLKGNLNVKGAYLHVLGDALGSVGAIIAAVAVMKFNFTQADGIASIFVSVLIAKSGFYLLKDSFNVLIQAVPADLDAAEILRIIKSASGVISVHDLHIWAINGHANALAAHVTVDKNLKVCEISQMIKSIESELSRVGVDHVTLQFESLDTGHSDEIICGI